MVNFNQKLVEFVEQMGIYVGKHPTGALTLTAYGASRVVLPEANGWRVTEPKSYGGSRVVAAYPHEDIDKLVADVQDWARKQESKQ
jgi:hypothetical protein